MILFVILICLGLQHFSASQRYDHFSLFKIYSQTGTRMLAQLPVKNGWVALILLLIPVLIVVAGINYILSGIWFNSLNFLFNLAVLYYCLGAYNRRRQLQNYVEALEKDDLQAAYYDAGEFLKAPMPTDRVTLIRQVTRQIFCQADRYIFSVLFWYILLGPTAVLIYMLTDYLSNLDSLAELPIVLAIRQAATIFLAILAWIPARISGFSYALVGHFAYAISAWRKDLWTPLALDFASEIGLAALELTKEDTVSADVEENKRALDLVEKAIILWLAVIAVLTLFSWIT
ncbi:MAG TPA: regulatory signaling modulator protein AmpE [Gammaproteobacteria bacterium]|nr:regulatory signaling modulator protein AmpE [Gammaproteobacteria bacterium]